MMDLGLGLFPEFIDFSLLDTVIANLGHLVYSGVAGPGIGVAYAGLVLFSARIVGTTGDGGQIARRSP